MAKKDPFGMTGSETIIGSSVRMKGNLTSDGDITVDGRMAGNIKSGGHVTIGVNAQVVGDVNATSVSVGGRLEGNIKALDSTSILESGQVLGDIDTTSIEIAMGGIFVGVSKMKPARAREIGSVEEPAAQ